MNAKDFRKQWSHQPTAIPANATGLWYSEECVDEMLTAFVEQLAADGFLDHANWCAHKRYRGVTDHAKRNSPCDCGYPLPDKIARDPSVLRLSCPSAEHLVSVNPQNGLIAPHSDDDGKSCPSSWLLHPHFNLERKFK